MFNALRLQCPQKSIYVFMSCPFCVLFYDCNQNESVANQLNVEVYSNPCHCTVVVMLVRDRQTDKETRVDVFPKLFVTNVPERRGRELTVPAAVEDRSQQAERNIAVMFTMFLGPRCRSLRRNEDSDGQTVTDHCLPASFLDITNYNVRNI
jgi:hypothetical protein